MGQEVFYILTIAASIAIGAAVAWGYYAYKSSTEAIDGETSYMTPPDKSDTAPRFFRSQIKRKHLLTPNNKSIYGD